MADFTTIKAALESRGFTVTCFADKAAAAEYLDGAIDGVSVGFGGSATMQDLGLYESLGSHNTVHWHWKEEDMNAARSAAATADVYLSSANAIAETTDAKVLTFHSCQTVSRQEFNDGATYLSLMWHNVEALKEGLA